MIRHDITGIAGRTTALAMATLRVDIIADLVCPWCYLGKRRLDTALAAVGGPAVVGWSPFQLNPRMPKGGVTIEDYLTSRFGDIKALQPGLEELTAAGKAEGILFRFNELRRVPNTLDAHRLMLHAVSREVAVPDMAESLFRRFFEFGEDISRRDVLVDAGQEHGLTRADVGKMLDDDHTRRQVLAQEGQIRHGGVKAVPDFLLNNRLLVMGAQSSDALVDAFDRAMFGDDSEQTPAGPLH